MVYNIACSVPRICNYRLFSVLLWSLLSKLVWTKFNTTIILLYYCMCHTKITCHAVPPINLFVIGELERQYKKNQVTTLNIKIPRTDASEMYVT